MVDFASAMLVQDLPQTCDALVLRDRIFLVGEDERELSAGVRRQVVEEVVEEGSLEHPCLDRDTGRDV